MLGGEDLVAERVESSVNMNKLEIVQINQAAY